MKLHLENIGKIKEADVDIGGLTLIAGNNDTGKSSVGKVMFGIILSPILRDGAREEVIKK